MKQKYNRIIPVIAAIAIQLCLGTAYIWSVFQNGIASSIFGGSNADAALTFSLLLALLGIGGTIGGTLQNKIGPRITVIIGGLILSIGFFVASFTTSSVPWLLWLTYGVPWRYRYGLYLFYNHCMCSKVVSRQKRFCYRYYSFRPWIWRCCLYAYC